MKSFSNLTSRSRLATKLSDEKGMTLIEIMIVIAIIAGLMAVLGRSAADFLAKSKVGNTKIQLSEVAKQLEAYNMDCNSYPTTDQGLKALVASPGADACPNWGPNPYMKNEPKDGWGRTLIYESDGGQIIALRSLGRDKKEGGEGYDKDIDFNED
jgi:general secretion pathway protein G